MGLLYLYRYKGDNLEGPHGSKMTHIILTHKNMNNDLNKYLISVNDTAKQMFNAAND